jgi:hypothetical protein
MDYLGNMNLLVFKPIPEGHTPVTHPKPKAIIRVFQLKNITLGWKHPQVSFNRQT